MTTEEDRCAQARKLQRIDNAFRTGDLDGLRAAVDDPAVVPNGRWPPWFGSCLVYAIYHSPLAFIRTLLATGADVNAPVDYGFSALIAAPSSAREVPGAGRRTDVHDIPPVAAVVWRGPESVRHQFLPFPQSLPPRDSLTEAEK